MNRSQKYEQSDKAKATRKAYREAHSPTLEYPEDCVTDAEKDEYRSSLAAVRAMARNHQERNIWGVDGEGGSDEQGNHHYLLLTAGPYSVVGRPLGWQDCLRFLGTLHEREDWNNPLLVSFFFDYDVTMMLRSWPEDKLRKLVNREERHYVTKKGRSAYAYVYHNGYAVDYVPRKSFTVRYQNGPAITINDVCGFYQQSFVAALTAWGIGSEHLEQIKAGKNDRAGFTDVLLSETIEYNKTEVVLLAELVGALRRTHKELGYPLSQYQGAGCSAQAVMKRHSVNKAPELPETVRDAASYAYHGGRFEVATVGAIPGVVHEYDIASAYPDAMRHLPCLMHGEWVHVNGVPRGGHSWGNKVLQLCLVTWISESSSKRWGPLPFRRADGSKHYPLTGKGWYWGTELQYVYDHADYWIHETWTFIQHCDCPSPYAFIPDIYATRQRIGKSNKGKVLKLSLNSLYGKTAQSVGMASYANPVYAGWITAYVRGRMLDIINRFPQDVVMVATDGIYLSRNIDSYLASTLHDAGTPTPLGEWEHAAVDSFYIVQPGVYYGMADGKEKTRTRGIGLKFIADKETEFRDAFKHNGWDGYVDVPLTSFVGLRSALHRNHLDVAGQWFSANLPETHKRYQPPRRIAFGSNNDKRVLLPIGDGLEYGETLARPTGEGMSAKYAKNIGGILDPLAFSIMTEGPDWLRHDTDTLGDWD